MKLRTCESHKLGISFGYACFVAAICGSATAVGDGEAVQGLHAVGEDASALEFFLELGIGPAAINKGIYFAAFADEGSLCWDHFSGIGDGSFVVGYFDLCDRRIRDFTKPEVAIFAVDRGRKMLLGDDLLSVASLKCEFPTFLFKDT